MSRHSDRTEDPPKRESPDWRRALAFILIIVGVAITAYAFGIEGASYLPDPLECVYPNTGEPGFTAFDAPFGERIVIYEWDEDLDNWVAVGMFRCG